MLDHDVGAENYLKYWECDKRTDGGSRLDLIIKQIMAAEERLVDAHVRMDIELIDNLLHPDDAIIQPRGIFETKEQVLDPYRSRLRYWEFARSDQMDFHIRGDSNCHWTLAESDLTFYGNFLKGFIILFAFVYNYSGIT